MRRWKRIWDANASKHRATTATATIASACSPTTVRLDLEVPRDRQGRFEPQLVEKYARRLAGFDDKVISMYARGMTTREIRAHVAELYGVTVSAELVSKVTDAVMDEVAEWQSRPLEEVYAIVYFDAVRVKIRDPRRRHHSAGRYRINHRISACRTAAQCDKADPA